MREGDSGPHKIGARFAGPLEHESRSVTIAGHGRRARSAVRRRRHVLGARQLRHANRMLAQSLIMKNRAPRHEVELQFMPI
jgi:hypothetical protein